MSHSAVASTKEVLINYFQRHPFAVEIMSEDELRQVGKVLNFLDPEFYFRANAYPCIIAIYFKNSPWGSTPIAWGAGLFNKYPVGRYNLGKRYKFDEFKVAFEGILFPKKRKEVKTQMKDIVEIKFKQEGERQLLSIELLDRELANLFKNEDTETSEKYTDADGDGLEFYALSDKLSKFSKKFNGSDCNGRPVTLRKYGSTLVSEEEGGQKFNLSILRSVDIQDGVTVDLDGLILKEDINAWAESLANFLKYAYRAFVVEKGHEVRATVTLEY